MKNTDNPLFNGSRIYKSLIENEVIDILLNWNKKREKSDLRSFLSGIFYLDQKAYFDYEGFYVSKTILRDELKLEKDKKPGDIDVIIIPFTKTKIYFDRTSVYEIKIVRPTRKNPGRNANSLVVTQALGLAEDGFPLVGLIHISITEPLSEQEKVEIKFSTLKANSGVGKQEGKSCDDYLIDLRMDQFAWWSSENQIKRLMTLELPDFIGVSSYGLEFYDHDRMVICTLDVYHQKLAACCFNPKTSQLTVLKIQNHFLKHKNKYKLILNKIPE
jgi:hypothetical protein